MISKLTIITVFAVLLAASLQALAVDPEQTPTFVITCEYPVEREDGAPLALNEIAQVLFFVSHDQQNWLPAGSNTAACRQVYNLTTVADGQYYYTATVVDTDGRESGYSAAVPLLVKRVQPPKPPGGMSGLAS